MTVPSKIRWPAIPISTHSIFEIGARANSSIMVTKVMLSFDYGAPAELFASPRRGFGKHAMKYRRFATSAEAIQFVVEQLPPLIQNGTVLEVGEERFETAEIHELYNNSRYPLKRSLE